jgi:hypothetical protein
MLSASLFTEGLFFMQGHFELVECWDHQLQLY